ncbi:MAG: tRNA dihydrouridine synthase DusB [Actinomycetota bacterium]|nr:tRNA dihydrouridine synthase DusB [Actinomycetota bacterium]
MSVLMSDPGERIALPLQVGDHVIDPPVVLAPMAGITNRAFRRLCRESGAGLYVSEMTTSRALVERNAATMDMVSFAEDEYPRSVQLYGVDPQVMAAAVRIIVSEDRADHIDMNFGCPVPKVTRKGGGSALPWKKDLFASIVHAAVDAANGRVPVSVKMRKGIDDDHLTYLQAGRTAAEAGVSWVALHARTTQEMYSGHADWLAIARLKEELDPLGVPVLGNGDIWTASDAMQMMEQTGADGVVVGRGCLGRPWLFGHLAAAFRGDPLPPEPKLDEVLRTLRRHAELLCSDYDETKGCRDIRKHMAWYLKGFRVAQPVRQALGTVASLSELDSLLAQINGDQEFNTDVGSGPRGRTSGERAPALPEGWLDTPFIDEQSACSVAEAELSVSGG